LLLITVVFVSEEARENIYFTVMVVSWSITEMIRYAYYAISQIGQVPFILHWLRYSTFFVLYPSGAGGEAIVLYHSLPFFIRTHKFSLVMPNPYNFIFNFVYFLYVILLIYPPGLFVMMKHMYIQRSKKNDELKEHKEKKDHKEKKR